MERKQEISNKIKEYALCSDITKPGARPHPLDSWIPFAFWSVAVQIALQKSIEETGLC